MRTKPGLKLESVIQCTKGRKREMYKAVLQRLQMNTLGRLCTCTHMRACMSVLLSVLLSVGVLGTTRQLLPTTSLQQTFPLFFHKHNSQDKLTKSLRFYFHLSNYQHILLNIYFKTILSFNSLSSFSHLPSFISNQNPI